MHINNINIESRMKHYHVNGLSIAKIENSQITGAENYGLLEVESDQKVTEHSIFSACSISKFLTGIVTIKLVEEQLLNLDENVNDKLVAWKVFDNEYTKYKKVTLRNLLSHQSGILDLKEAFLK